MGLGSALSKVWSWTSAFPLHFEPTPTPESSAGSFVTFGVVHVGEVPRRSWDTPGLMSDYRLRSSLGPRLLALLNDPIPRRRCGPRDTAQVPTYQELDVPPTS